MAVVPTPSGGSAISHFPFSRRARWGLLACALCLLSLFAWSCNSTGSDDTYSITLKLDSSRVGQFDSVRVDIYNGAVPQAGDTAKPAQTQTLAVTSTTKSVTLTLDKNMKKDFSVVVTGFSGGQIAYRNLHEVNNLQPPDSAKQSVLLISRIQADSLTLSVGETRLPTLTLTPADAKDKKVVLASEDSARVIVVGDSLKGKSAGTAKVKASTPDGAVSVEFAVTVMAVRVTGLSADSVIIKVGDTVVPDVKIVPDNATDKGYSLQSSDTTLFSVNGKSLIGLKAGQGKLILSSHDGGADDTVIVRIRIPVTAIAGKDLTLEVGDKVVPVLEFTPADATLRGYALSSSDTAKVAVIGDKDSLEAKAIGSSKITVKTNDGGFTADFTVDVVKKVFHVQSVAATALRGLVGDTLDPKLTWTPDNATEKGLILRSLDSGVVETAGERLVAKAMGKTKVELTTVDGGKKDSFDVSIEASNFNQDIKPITSSKCAPCHVPPPSVTFNWTDSAQLARKGVIAMDRLTRSDTAQGHMPLPGATGGALTKRELAILLEWLARVSVPLKSIAVADTTCNFGDTVVPIIVFTPSNATNKVYALATSDTNVVAVRGGALLPVDMGTVSVDVICDEGARARFTLTVKAPAFDRNIKPITKVKCAPCHLTGATFNWQDSSNLITDGAEAIRRLTLPDTATGRMPLSLQDNPPPNGELSPLQLKILLSWLHTKVVPLKGINVPDDSLKLQESKEPAINWNPANATNKFFTLASSDTTKVGILGTEMVGKGLGTTTVVVTTAEGNFSKVINVKVLPIPVDSIQVRDTGCAKDDKVYVKAIFFPSNATNQAFTLASVAVGGTKVRIDSGFKVTALALGKDTLEATTADGGKKKRFVFNVGPVLPKALAVPDTNGLVSSGSLSPVVIPRVIWTPTTTTDKRVTLVITGDTTNIAAVRNDSTLQPKSLLGKVSVTATSVADPTVMGTFSFTVGPVHVTSFTVNTVAAAHDKDTLIPFINWTPTNPTNQNYSLSVGIADTAKIGVVGVRLAVKKTGTSTITVTSLDSNKTAPWSVTTVKTSFQANMLNIMTNRCGSCHHAPGTATQPNWQDSTTMVAFSAQIQARLDIAYDPANPGNGHMPYGSAMRADSIAIIKAWLNQ